MNETEIVANEVAQATAEGREISDLAARIIASWWHGGQGTRLYAFVSSGAIEDDPWQEVIEEYPQADETDRLYLDFLGTYFLNREDKGPVPDWADRNRF